jgi:hypothetical protein
MRRAIEYFDDCNPNAEVVPEEGREEWEDLCDRQQLLEWFLQKEEKLEKRKKEARKLQWILVRRFLGGLVGVEGCSALVRVSSALVEPSSALIGPSSALVGPCSALV